MNKNIEDKKKLTSNWFKDLQKSNDQFILNL